MSAPDLPGAQLKMRRGYGHHRCYGGGRIRARVDFVLPVEEKLDTADAKLAEIAARQHGVATISQIRAAGWNKNAVSKGSREGRLHRLHRGVYAVGHRAPSLARDWMAAVLACGEGAVLSHASAAALWGLLRPIEGPVDVSVPSSSGRLNRREIRLHRCRSLVSPGFDDIRGRELTLVTVRNRIPVTTVPRTIDDLRGAVPPYLVRRATRQAELAGYRIQGAETKRTRSDLEGDFLDFCRRQGIPCPEVNVKVGSFEVDFLWRDKRVVVETDDFRYHRGSVAFEDDHAREPELRRRGFAVRRFTGRQIDEESDRVAADLLDALSTDPRETSGGHGRWLYRGRRDLSKTEALG